jgi:hypothetical protein
MMEGIDYKGSILPVTKRKNCGSVSAKIIT